MKTIFAGSELNTALRELKKEVPGIDRLIFSANGKLDITGFNSTNFQGTTVHMPCNSVIDGTAGMKSFDLLFSLSQDKEFKESELVFATDGDDTLSLITTIRHTETIKGKGYHDKTRKFQMLVPADYRFEAMKERDIPINIAPVTKDEAEPEAAPLTPSADLIKFVTVPSVMVKGYLPRTRDDKVIIASTSKAVLMLVRNGDSSTAHILAASTTERFSLEIPVKVLRQAIKASDTLTIGIREKGFEWHGLKDTHKHQAKYDWQEERHDPRQSFRFTEGISGEVNGIPVPNVKKFDNHERDHNTCIPHRHAIAYRDTMQVPEYREHGRDSADKQAIYSQWHYVRLLNVPPAIAEAHARIMSEKYGRLLESVYLGQSDEEIVLEPSINPLPAWKVIRVDRKQNKHYYEDHFEVFATFKIEKITHKPPVGVNGDQCRKRIARDLTDEQSKILVKRLDLASKLLNGEIEQDASNTLENMLTEAAPKVATKETLFGEVNVRTEPVHREAIRPAAPRPSIPEPPTINLFE